MLRATLLNATSSWRSSTSVTQSALINAQVTSQDSTQCNAPDAPVRIHSRFQNLKTSMRPLIPWHTNNWRLSPHRLPIPSLLKKLSQWLELKSRKREKLDLKKRNLSTSFTSSSQPSSWLSVVSDSSFTRRTPAKLKVVSTKTSTPSSLSADTLTRMHLLCIMVTNLS